MANPNALFGVPVDIARADERIGTRISLGPDLVARLNPNDGRSRALEGVLEDRRRRRMPVYLELDANGFIERARIPKLVRVQRIVEEADGTVSVLFENSHARHIVRDPEILAAVRAVSRERWLAVTVNDRSEVIDLRPYDPPFEVRRFEPPPLPRPTPWYHWPWWPWRWFACISLTRAQQLFDLCALRTCEPVSVPPPCIPFMFPDDGCWGRAHEMARLMIEDGYTPRKIWIDAVTGWLTAATTNHPACFVEWGWHVAPVVCVRKWLWWPFLTREMVIDPSLFTTPVTVAQWKSVQGNATAALTFSSYTQFGPDGETDPTYEQTEQVLADYRVALAERAATVGPPPYAACT
jgi:hypothetical protein